jgi:hypothetical protein
MRGRASIALHPVLQKQPESKTQRVESAVQQAAEALLHLQRPEGYWWEELESNVTITAEYLMLHRFLGLPGQISPFGEGYPFPAVGQRRLVPVVRRRR